MTIEREMQPTLTPEARSGLLERLDAIDEAVNDIKTPLAFADQLYGLRGHVSMVRVKLLGRNGGAVGSSEAGASA